MRVGTIVDLECRCGKRFRWVSKSGKRPIWCSDLCRKTMLYSTPCEKCGAPTKGNSGGKASRYCSPCGSLVAANYVREVAAVRLAEIEHMWQEGFTKAEIAEELEITVPGLNSQMNRWRKEGANLPYRYKYSRKGLQNLRRQGRKRAAEMHAPV